MSELTKHLSAQKEAYLHQREHHGGTAEGFRERIRALYASDPAYYNAKMLDALMEATTKKWEQEPRKRGPDLFSFNGYSIPEHLTRPVYGEEGDVDEKAFEKLHQQYASLQDLFDDATIKLRVGARSLSVAEEQMQAVDYGRRKARGDMRKLLRDIKD
jgi:hypothetical protein